MGIAIWKLETPDCYKSVDTWFCVGKSMVGAVAMQVYKAAITLVHSWVIKIQNVPEIIEALSEWASQTVRLPSIAHMGPSAASSKGHMII